MDVPQERCRINAPYTRRLPSPPKYTIPALFSHRLRIGDSHSSWEAELPPGFQTLPRPYVQWEYKYRQQAQLVAPFIFLGPSSVAKEPELLRYMNISSVLMVRRASKEFATRITPTGLRISREAGLRVELLDVEDYQQLASKFTNTSELLIELTQIRPENRVLVCCESGNDMSAAVVVAYIMNKFQVDMVRAVQIVQMRRFCISISDDLQRLLDAYQGILKAQRDVSTSMSLDECGRDEVTTKLSKRARAKTEMDHANNDDEEGSIERQFAPFLDN